MSAALMRRCPKCTVPYLKSDGCAYFAAREGEMLIPEFPGNYITCVQCHTGSCYVCQQIVRPVPFASPSPQLTPPFAVPEKSGALRHGFAYILLIQSYWSEHQYQTGYRQPGYPISVTPATGKCPLYDYDNSRAVDQKKVEDARKAAAIEAIAYNPNITQVSAPCPRSRKGC